MVNTNKSAERASKLPSDLPPQSVFVDPASFAVLPKDGPFRTDANKVFNPTNTTPPFFQIFNTGFLSILGSTPSINVIATNPDFAFAHEAPIYVPETDEVFFCSNAGGPLGMSDINNNNKVFKISLAEAEAAMDANGGGDVNVTVTEVPLSDDIQMTNGGTGPFNGKLVFVNSGRGSLPPSVVLVDPKPPYTSKTLLNSYYGRQFDSLNDVKVHPGSGKLFFTDDYYGYINQFRPAPLMPGQVYCFDPDTSTVRVVATDFNKPNGIAFTGDGLTAYVSDTGFAGGTPTEPATIYAFDVDETTHAFKNRRVLAFADTGIPDGLQVDTEGNLFTGCGDGVHVLATDGTLLGKIFTGTLSANMVFAPPNRMVILAETKVFLAKIVAQGVV
ncbi:calcium-dependent phosphotriesterase [Macrolepiota fuliginosa MF-IS2]|uniref:Calcium-dependent phosphotriesterase n=1 Tax=Macrolepiota fuliginosa MF-IS2 TaxID=1400762 RepID=A0A9P6C7X1_9AGAR|nr:calcium-dependent phosphotriesterase [Macrolepiota fuliginosa MF-IS2]